MNYVDQFRSFISSYQLFTGLRLTLATLVPSLIFYHFGLLGTMAAFPLGVLLIGVADSPGPPQRRFNAILINILVCFLVATLTYLLRNVPFIIYLEIVVFGILFSMIGVYGGRASGIGTIALLVFIFNIDQSAAMAHGIPNAAIFSAGGLWYLLIFYVMDKLIPYKLIQQLLGENFLELSRLMDTRSRFYFPKVDYDTLLYKQLQLQVRINETQESLREILFKTRQVVTESTHKSRILMMMFLDSMNLYEQIMNSQQDYRKLHRLLGNNKMLVLYGTYIHLLSVELQRIGISVQSGTSSRAKRDLDLAYQKCETAFVRLRDGEMTADNVETFIMLRQILNTLKDVTDRVKKLHLATAYDATLGDSRQLDVEPDSFLTSQDYHPRLLLDNLSLKSSHFRHSLRITTALLLGYTASWFFPVGHGYWILLTIVTIMKPAFSITKQRNINRLLGTIVGVVAGFLIITYVADEVALFVIMMAAMIIAYSFLKSQYFIASLGITVYVILSFHFMYEGNITTVITDRLVDTATGSLIAYVVASSVMPLWEYTQIRQYILAALEANSKYFKVVSETFAGNELQVETLKLSRKNALIALANLSDIFQKMLSEPKRKQVKLTEYHQFVSTSWMLTSYLASLSSYAQLVGTEYKSDTFAQVSKEILRQFGIAIGLADGTYVDRVMVIKQPLPTNPQLAEMLAERKREIRDAEKGQIIGSVDQKKLSNLTTIDGLFVLIHTLVIDEAGILEKLRYEFPNQPEAVA